VTDRTKTLQRQTSETLITVTVNLDGAGTGEIRTGQGFLDHMLRALATHSMVDLKLSAKGDLETGCHHLLEDCGLALGAVLREAVAGGGPVKRFGSALVPMDEALSRVAIDLSGRPFAAVQLPDGSAGGVGVEDAGEFFRGLSTGMLATVHVEALAGENTHHVLEASFKALALSLRQAIELDARRCGTPSTKGDVRLA
jgi:imidazoleglycerol-phosphate dehydratase